MRGIQCMTTSLVCRNPNTKEAQRNTTPQLLSNNKNSRRYLSVLSLSANEGAKRLKDHPQAAKHLPFNNLRSLTSATPGLQYALPCPRTQPNPRPSFPKHTRSPHPIPRLELPSVESVVEALGRHRRVTLSSLVHARGVVNRRCKQETCAPGICDDGRTIPLSSCRCRRRRAWGTRAPSKRGGIGKSNTLRQLAVPL